MKLLLLSNSTTYGYSYLEHAFEDIKNFFSNNVKKIAFIPYAGVTISWDDYTEKVSNVFTNLDYQIISIHTGNPREIINSCDAIAVGGGNTFNLLKTCYENDLISLIREKVKSGVPYIGWSAGSNLTCPTIRTTNDMPIVEPPSFNALNLIPFQINPHYLDAHPDGHFGETREQRLLEFLELNKIMNVVGLREGSSLLIENNSIKLLGNKTARIFKYGSIAVEKSPGDDFSFLLE